MRLLRLLPRFRQARAALDLLSGRETWSRRQISNFQLARINEIWQHASKWVPYYRELAEQQHLPLVFDSLEHYCGVMPLLPKYEVRNNPMRFLSERCERGHWHRTSGSTGSPMQVYHANSAHREMLQGKYRLYQTLGVDPLDRMAVVWGTAQGNRGRFSRIKQRWKQELSDSIRGRMRLSAYYSDPDTLRQQLRQIAAFRPASIYGYSQAVWLLAQQAKLDGFSCDSLKAVFLTSEPVFERMQSDVAEAFGVPVAIEYGATECEIIAGRSTDGLLRVREDIVMLETLPRDDDRGDIVLTILLNPSFPLLRYEIGDISEGLLQMPTEGFAILPEVAGRNDDRLTTQSGHQVHATLVDAFFEERFAHLPIRRYRLHQNGDGSIRTLLEVTSGTLPPAEIFNIQSQLQSIVGGYRVQVDVTRHIQVPETGKLRIVTSELQSRTTQNPSTSPVATMQQT